MRRSAPRGPRPAHLFAWVQALFVLLLGASSARALDWATLAQPVGTYVGDTANPGGVYSPAAINTVLGGIPPFDSATSVTLIRLTQTQQFVRFYNPTDPANPSSAIGSWMMRASEIRGLTVEQIRAKFALPALPTNMVQVVVPTGYALYTGIAAPIAGWGEGGGLQNRAMAGKPPSAEIAADPWLPASSYANAQALGGAPVLSYKYAASGSKAGARMGAYMDGVAPRAGSDLEGIYNALDTLAFTGGSAGVAQAMGRFSPAQFDALNRVNARTGVLLAAAFDARAASLALGLDAAAPGGATSGEPVLLAFSGGLGELAEVLSGRGQRQARLGEWGLWLRGTGEYVRDNAKGQTPYSAVTAAVHAGADRSAGPGLVLGLGVGFARTHLDWEQDGGEGVTNTASLSGYGFWTGGEYFANGDVTVDAAFTEARRRILTVVADRVARSSQSGEGVAARVRAGRRMALEAEGWTLTPALELAYGLHRQNAFSENGAGDLDLDVRPATAQTLRTGAELALGRRMELTGRDVLIVEAALGWQRETPLDSRVMRSSFSGYAQSFQTYGDDTPRDSLLVRAGLTEGGADGFTRYARYSGTVRDRFQAHSLELGCRWSF